MRALGGSMCTDSLTNICSDETLHLKGIVAFGLDGIALLG